MTPVSGRRSAMPEQPRPMTPKRATAALDSGAEPRDLKRGRLVNVTREDTAELQAELVEVLGRAQALGALKAPRPHPLSGAGAGAAREAVATRNFIAHP